MVSRVLKLLHREFNGLHQAALVLAVAVFASQLLSLVQYRLLAATFGAGRELDIFYSAFRLPDFIYVSIASFVSISVLVPMIIQKLRQNNEVAVQFLNATFTAFCAVMLTVTLIAYFLVPLWRPLIVPGFSPTDAATWITMTRIILLSPLFLGLSNLLGSFTQSLRKFLVYAISPIFYQLGNVIGIALFYPLWGLPGLAWGTVLGALCHMAIQLPTLRQAGFWPRLTTRLDYRELRQVILVSLPRTLGMATSQLSIMALSAIASLMPIGSIALFNLAFSLQGIPLGLIGVSYSVAAFPTLAKLFHAGDNGKFNQHTGTAIRQILFWSVPISVLFIVLRAQIVRVVLGSGHFNWSDTRLTAAALALFVVSVFAQSLALLFVRGYYAGGRTWKPLFINLGSAIITIVLAYGFNYLFATQPMMAEVFNQWLRVDDLSRTAVLALPLAFSLGSLLNTFVFWYFWRRDFGPLGGQVRRTWWQSLISGLLAGVVAYLALNLLDDLFNIQTLFGIFFQGLIAGLGAIVVDIIILRWLGNEELAELTFALKKRFWKAKPISAEMPQL